jgi:hypothetical protein
VTRDRNSQSVQFVEPNPVYCPGLAVGQYDCPADKLVPSLIELGKDHGRVCLSSGHGAAPLGLEQRKSTGRSHIKALSKPEGATPNRCRMGPGIANIGGSGGKILNL